MTFTELNSVEYHIINQLTGVDLNATQVSASKPAYGTKWIYKSSPENMIGEGEYDAFHLN